MNTNEFRVFGIPGSGKTTYLTRQIERAAKIYGATGVLVTSFTKAAAQELVSREMSLSSDMIGTLHAHCYRMLGNPVIAETKVKEFNEENTGYAMSGKSVSDIDMGGDDDMGSAINAGDKLMSKLQYYRNNLVPEDRWGHDVADFAMVWDDFKKQTDTLDFTDLIEKASDTPPHDAAVGFVDEAQDLTPLQFRLIRKWGEQFKKFVVCGDDDQALYRWAGASAKSMLYPTIPEENKIHLSTTWRCPSEIQNVAAKWIERINEREPKTQATNRDIPGEVIDTGYGYNNILALADDIEDDVAAGRTAMVLTACSYQLSPIIKELRARGIPFWNKYRLTRGDWNPIRKSTVNRLLAFLEPEYGVLDNGMKLWSMVDILKWGKLVKFRGIMPNGFMTAVENQMKDSKEKKDSDKIADVLKFFEDWSVVEKLMDKDIDWLYDNAKAERERGMEFPMMMIEKYGVESLRRDPLVTIGTIHSVKGGEAGSVYLAPDISKAAYKASVYEQECLDDVVRQFYVGMTRASEKLNILQPCTQWHVTGMIE